MKKIITHPGLAHQDDFLACAILVNFFEIGIERKEPTSEDLSNPEIIVVDVSGQYNPDMNNFDHHQDKSLPCSLHLVWNKFCSNLSSSSELTKMPYPWMAYPWWDFIDIQDREGIPTKFIAAGIGQIEIDSETDEKLFKPPKMNDCKKLIAPISTIIIDLFSQIGYCGKGDSMWELLKKIGHELYEGVYKFKTGYERCSIEANVCITEMKANSARFSFAEKHGADMIVAPNERGTGFVLTALDGSGMTFNYLKGREKVKYVNATGFMAVVDDYIKNYEDYVE